MEFLREALGEDFDGFAEKLSCYNAENPDRVIELVNLAAGEYIPAAEADRLRLENAIELELIRSGTKDSRLIRKLIDTDTVSFRDGELTGLDVQLERLKKDNPYLFSETKVSTGMRQGTAKPSHAGFFKAILDNQAKR